MGRPAARLTDMHVCPMVTGLVPHVGGPISVPCAPTVLIGSLPSARVGDMAICVGPPDFIAPPGAPTVMISGMPAARMGDGTVHGGRIVFGNFTVLIGNSGCGGGGGGGAAGPPRPSSPGPDSCMEGAKRVAAPFIKTIASAVVTGVEAVAGVLKEGWGPAQLPGHTIQVNGTPQEVAQFDRWLNEIRNTPTGAEILTEIDSSGRQVTIVPDAASRATAGATAWADRTAAGDGTGTDSTIRFDATVPDHGSHWVFDSNGNQIEFTATQNLFHELSHARNNALGVRNAADPEGQAITQENVFRQEQMALPPGVAGPPAPAPQRDGHAGVVRSP